MTTVRKEIAAIGRLLGRGWARLAMRGRRRRARMDMAALPDHLGLIDGIDPCRRR